MAYECRVKYGTKVYSLKEGTRVSVTNTGVSHEELQQKQRFKRSRSVRRRRYRHAGISDKSGGQMDDPHCRVFIPGAGLPCPFFSTRESDTGDFAKNAGADASQFGTRWT